MEASPENEAAERGTSPAAAANNMAIATASTGCISPPSAPVLAATGRKLVTVRCVARIEQLAHPRGHCLVHVDGWTVLIRRAEWENWPKKWTNIVVFFEIDSLLPRTDHFREYFINPYKVVKLHGNEGYPVKTMVVEQHLSQGLIFPPDRFQQEIIEPYEARRKKVGDLQANEELFTKSYQDVLGVVKYEPHESIPMPEKTIGRIPPFIVNPTWGRAQNYENIIFAEGNRDKVWQVTEKLDGVTMQVYKLTAGSKWIICLPHPSHKYPETMHHERGHVGVCSRRDDFMDHPDNIYWQAAKDSGVTTKIFDIPYPNIAVQGEICGSSIGQNTMKFPEGRHKFYVFGIWNFDTATYVDVREAERICGELGLAHVPVVGYTTMPAFAGDMATLLARAGEIGPGEFGGAGEGLVFKTLTGAEHFKAISNKWLALTGN